MLTHLTLSCGRHLRGSRATITSLQTAQTLAQDDSRGAVTTRPSVSQKVPEGTGDQGQSPADTLKVYSGLIGSYEFYCEERYSLIRIYPEAGALMGQEQGHDPIILEPVDLKSLQFTAYNGAEYFKITFLRNAEGQIARLILSAKEWECLAERMFTTSRRLSFSLTELQEDFRQLRKAMEENSFILYQFTDSLSFGRLFDRQFGKITGPMSREEFRRIIAPVVAQVGCLHTSLWMPPGYWKNVRASLMPLRLVFLRGKGYVWQSYAKTEEIPAGSEIIAVNGKPMSDILDVLKANISADGYNDSFRTFKINEGFSYRYGLDFGYPDRFAFLFQLPGQNKPRQIVLNAVDLETVEKFGKEKNSTEYNALDYTRRFEVLAGKDAGLLTIKSFAYYSHPEVFNGFIDSVFNKIRDLRIHTLILDLRGNNGGNPFCSVHLFSHLQPRPLPYFAEEYGKYALLAQPTPMAKHPFTGRLLTLIDGNNVSTTPHLCALLKYHKIGTFIGTETGGTYICNAATREIHLKHTRFIILVSRKSFAAAVEGLPRDQGILPDHPVQPTIEDLIEGRDVAMEYTLRLLDQN